MCTIKELSECGGMWRDVFSGCLCLYYNLFYFLEDSLILDCNNPIHMQALHAVYMPRINQSLLQFQSAWNRHPLRTTSNMSPIQLWVRGMLKNYKSQHLPVQETFTAMSDSLHSSDQPRSDGEEEEEEKHS